MTPPASAPPGSAPPPSRRFALVFVVGFIALQLVLPLHYYLVRRDRHDERFAWRMFSSTRMLRCAVEFRIDDRPVELAATFHDAWIALASRGRRVVIEAMGAKLCRAHPGSAVIARLRCTPVRGEPYPVGGFDLCSIPRL
ncbi:MAG: hypothetical protein KBG48_30950 [Kofleriaceae bacterium]|nr:hypothetical protein [Kofleriaceae bacterium]MBP9171852.1 hypothetical protein [Kofleriaceae bacterium]MBP9862901.1 hypothetical protein [Kofleriaceae bacterium]